MLSEAKVTVPAAHFNENQFDGKPPALRDEPLPPKFLNKSIDHTQQ